MVHIPVVGLFKYYPKEFNNKKPVILQIGTGSHKNVDRLIKALKGISCHLSVIGVLSDEQKRLLNDGKIGYSNAINISNEAIIKKYQEADILSFVSTYEGFGMPIVEAQIVGRPVITSNLSSMPEVAGFAALLVDPYNVEAIRKGILKIILDHKYRNNLIEKGRENAKRFSADTLAQQYVEIYREMANHKNLTGMNVD